MPPSSDESEDNVSVGYKSIHRMSPLTNGIRRTPTPPSKCTSPTFPHPTPLVSGSSMSSLAKSRFSSTSTSPLPSPLQPTKNPLYDYLTPGTTSDSTSNSITADDNGASVGERSSAAFSVGEEDDDESYVSLTPGDDRKTSPERQENVYSYPILSDDIINHCYEYLPPLKDDAGEGFDSYVYMAPRPVKSPPRYVARESSKNERMNLLVS